MTVIDFELDIFYKLPDGYVWCIAGCSVIGEHDGHPCTTCGGKGFMADPKTPDGRHCPPSGRPSGPTPRRGDATLPDSVTALGSKKEAI